MLLSKEKYIIILKKGKGYKEEGLIKESPCRLWPQLLNNKSTIAEVMLI